MGLQRFEQRLERMVEGTFAKAFRSGLQPVEIGRRLTREMDLRRRVSAHALIAPNSFLVALAADDAERFEHFVDALERELAESAREHAQNEGYEFVGPLVVEIRSDRRLRSGRCRIYGDILEGEDDQFAGTLVAPDGTRVGISDQPSIIGRMPECDLPLDDPNVSRRHAEVRRRGNDVVISDLGSTNGTRVNGTPVRGSHLLVDGDEITIGTTHITFRQA